MSQRLPDYESLRAAQARSQQTDRIGPEHVREVIAVHAGYGEEAWCPDCREHWPCKVAARA